MKKEYPQLPFPRGTTYKQGVSGITPDSSFGAGLEGQVYEVWDDTYDCPIKLRVVRNSTGDDLTLSRICVGFYSATSGYTKLGTDAIGMAADGDYAKPIDYVYDGDVTAEENDLFYVIDEGPALVSKTTGTGAGLTAGAAAYAGSATGKIAGTVSTGKPVGVVASTASTSDTEVRLYVLGGFRVG